MLVWHAWQCDLEDFWKMIPNWATWHVSFSAILLLKSLSPFLSRPRGPTHHHLWDTNTFTIICFTRNMHTASSSNSGGKKREGVWTEVDAWWVRVQRISGATDGGRPRSGLETLNVEFWQTHTHRELLSYFFVCIYTCLQMWLSARTCNISHHIHLYTCIKNRQTHKRQIPLLFFIW